MRFRASSLVRDVPPDRIIGNRNRSVIGESQSVKFPRPHHSWRTRSNRFLRLAVPKRRLVNCYLTRSTWVCLLLLALGSGGPLRASLASPQSVAEEEGETPETAGNAVSSAEQQEPRFVDFDAYLASRELAGELDRSVTSESMLLDHAAFAHEVPDLGAVETAGFFTPMPVATYPCDRYYFQILPDGLIYKSYLAGVKESRFSAHLVDLNEEGFVWDATLGARVGIFRYGNGDPVRPAGWQLDVEGSAQVRLDVDDDVDVRSVDFRGGVIMTYGDGWTQTKFGYYHLSSHLGDEFLLRNINFPRLNFARDVLVLGRSYYLTDEFRVYAEMGYAFTYMVSKPWEFQFGFEYAPAHATGVQGAPFFAVNGHLREEVDFGGNFVVQGGWAWRGDVSDNLLRAGIHYYNGESSQYSFYDEFEQQIGFGLWYDY